MLLDASFVMGRSCGRWRESEPLGGVLHWPPDAEFAGHNSGVERDNIGISAIANCNGSDDDVTPAIKADRVPAVGPTSNSRHPGPGSVRAGIRGVRMPHGQIAGCRCSGADEDFRDGASQPSQVLLVGESWNP